MHFLRRLFLFDLITGAVISLFLFCVALSAWLVVSSPQAVENALNKADVYSEIMPDALVQHPSTTIGGVPLSDPMVRAIIVRALPVPTVKSTATTVINGTYAWLQGKTQQPTFRVDLTPERDQITQNITAYVSSRYHALPACSPAQANALAPQSAENPYLLNCQLPTLNPSQVAAHMQRALLGGDGFLKTPVIDTATLKDKNGKPVISHSNTPPRIYRGIKRGVGALLLLAVLSLTGLIFAHPSGRRRGGRLAGSLTFSVGIVAILVAWLMSYLMRIAATKAAEDAARNHQPIGNLVMRAVHQVTNAISWHMAWIGGSLILSGVAVFMFCYGRQIPQPGPGEEDVAPQPNEAKSKKYEHSKP